MQLEGDNLKALAKTKHKTKNGEEESELERLVRYLTKEGYNQRLEEKALRQFLHVAELMNYVTARDEELSSLLEPIEGASKDPEALITPSHNPYFPPLSHAAGERPEKYYEDLNLFVGRLNRILPGLNKVNRYSYNEETQMCEFSFNLGKTTSEIFEKLMKDPKATSIKASASQEIINLGAFLPKECSPSLSNIFVHTLKIPYGELRKFQDFLDGQVPLYTFVGGLTKEQLDQKLSEGNLDPTLEVNAFTPSINWGDPEVIKHLFASIIRAAKSEEERTLIELIQKTITAETDEAQVESMGSVKRAIATFVEHIEKEEKVSPASASVSAATATRAGLNIGGAEVDNTRY